MYVYISMHVLSCQVKCTSKPWFVLKKKKTKSLKIPFLSLAFPRERRALLAPRPRVASEGAVDVLRCHRALCWFEKAQL